VIGREKFGGLIPHSGNMCLIDQVLEWDARSIHCRTRSHLDAAHPLRRDGRLDAVHLVEYGAQAMAIHGGLEARSRNSSVAPGMLASIRDLRLEVGRIDDLGEALEVRAQQVLINASGLLYEFSARCGPRILGGGRLTVMLLQQA
jgi:predicted hotdog family 3-hydroxylacyl-ACP dehydratase